MENRNFGEIPKFNSLEEEIAFLREKVESKEKELKDSGNEERSREDVTHEIISSYKEAPTREEDFEYQEDSLKLNLRPEAHDHQIEEFLGMLLESGVKKTLDYISSLKNPHLEDDFHRFLVQYFHTTGNISGLKERDKEFSALNMSLFEVTLPPENERENYKEFITGMVQFFAGMQTIAQGENSGMDQFYSLEIANPIDSLELMVYVSVPSTKKELLEKQILSFYKNAKIVEVTNDYNIFSYEGKTSASYAKFGEKSILPIKTFEDFDHDPMSAILNALSKLDREDEGGSMQIVVSPVGDSYIKKFSKILDKVKDGQKLGDAMDDFYDLKKDLKGFFVSPKKDDSEGKNVDEEIVSHIKKKIDSTIVLSNIRFAVSAKSQIRSDEILSQMESSFEQFSDTSGNNIKFDRIKEKELNHFIHSFSYRLPNQKTALPLNLKELSTIFHFPILASSPQLKEARSGQGSAPTNMGSEGVRIGTNIYRGQETPIYLKPEDRLRHMYIIGQTGTGKTGIMMNMIRQDILNGHGVCYIDPHGNDIQRILSYIPKERLDDVIYFDPADIERPMGLNMLEYDRSRPEQKTLVINELVGIFNQLFDMSVAGGPMFEQYFRNSAGLVMDHPESGNTLLEIGRVLSDKPFRDMKLQNCTNPIVKQFWTSAEATKGEQGLENFVPYITSKFDTFISNEIMRPIIAQEKSAINFRDIIDNKKILLVNLSKGRLGGINSNLIGLILVGKLQMAAMSRAETPGKEFAPFYLYIDEFQNVTTESIESILSEARKYKLSLTVAHQYISQLKDNIRGAILGNVGSMSVFRISSEDAEVLKGRFEPTFSVQDIIKLENRNAYISMLIDGQPAKPFNVKTDDFPEGNPDLVPKIKELSSLKYGRPRNEVEAEIFEKYQKLKF